MGMIKDFMNLPIYVKGVICTIALVLPFWFIIGAIKLPWLLTSSWYVIMLVISGPAIIWYGLSIIMVYLTLHSAGLKMNEESNDMMFWVAIGIDTVVYLVVISIVLILLKFDLLVILAILFGYKILAIAFANQIGKRLKKQRTIL